MSEKGSVFLAIKRREEKRGIKEKGIPRGRLGHVKKISFGSSWDLDGEGGNLLWKGGWKGERSGVPCTWKITWGFGGMEAGKANPRNNTVMKIYVSRKKRTPQGAGCPLGGENLTGPPLLQRVSKIKKKEG